MAGKEGSRASYNSNLLEEVQCEQHVPCASAIHLVRVARDLAQLFELGLQMGWAFVRWDSCPMCILIRARPLIGSIKPSSLF